MTSEIVRYAIIVLLLLGILFAGIYLIFKKDIASDIENASISLNEDIVDIGYNIDYPNVTLWKYPNETEWRVLE